MHTAIGDFLYTIGKLPFVDPNVNAPLVDLPKVVPQGDASGWVGPVLCCMTGIGCPYVCCRQFLVSRGAF